MMMNDDDTHWYSLLTIVTDGNYTLVCILLGYYCGDYWDPSLVFVPTFETSVNVYHKYWLGSRPSRRSTVSAVVGG